MDPASRARDHMANERTYLAWVRTAATVMVLGLGIAKFVEEGSARSAVAGGLLVGVGGVGLVFGGIRYRVVAREIERGEFIGPHATAPLVAGIVLLVAICAAFVLVLA